MSRSWTRSLGVAVLVVGCAGTRARPATLHELAHTFDEDQVAGFGAQPLWLQEGLAEYLAERVLFKDDVIARSAYFSQRMRAARGAGDSPLAMPLSKLVSLTEDVVWKPGNELLTTAFYGESYAFMRFLDSPKNPPRRERFRQYLRELAAAPAATTAGDLFTGAFGEVANLEPDFARFVRSEPLLPWLGQDAEVRPFGAEGPEAARALIRPWFAPLPPARHRRCRQS